MRIKVFVDGGARGNPGPAGVGGVIFPEGESKICFYKYIGVATNNVAEYSSVIEALIKINKTYDEKENLTVQVFMDSALVVNQLNGFFKVKNAKLRELICRVRELEKELGGSIIYKAIKREENVEADYLVNKALDERQQRRAVGK